VEDITAAAGTAKGNFYRYFDSFDDLIVAVRDHLLDDYYREVRARTATRLTIDWWPLLDEEIDAFFRFNADLAGLHHAVFHGPAAHDQPIDPQRTAATFIGGLLDAGIADGVFAPVDVDITAVLIFHVLHGAADLIATGVDADRTVAAAKHVIRRTLERPTRPDRRVRKAG
jgi:AcrR family transcriptional regulator